MKTTTADIQAVNSFYDRDLLFRAVPRLVHNRFAQVKDIPVGNSATITFKRYTALSYATQALTEGVTPAGSKLAETKITATVQQYGDYLELTDKLTMTTEDPVRLEANMLLGEQAGGTLDVLMRDIMVTGTNVIYSGSGNTAVADVAAGDVITLTNVELAEQTLKLANAIYMTSYVDASTGYNTAPLNPCFVGICHVNISPTVRAMTGFVKPELYADGSVRMDGEIGKVGFTRFIETVNAKVYTGAGTSNIDVYATLIIAQHAYGATRIGGHALENIVKPLGSGGTSDPLNQRETSGWKASFTGKILNDDFIIRIVHAKV